MSDGNGNGDSTQRGFRFGLYLGLLFGAMAGAASYRVMTELLPLPFLWILALWVVVWGLVALLGWFWVPNDD